MKKYVGCRPGGFRGRSLATNLVLKRLVRGNIQRIQRRNNSEKEQKRNRKDTKQKKKRQRQKTCA